MQLAQSFRQYRKSSIGIATTNKYSADQKKDNYYSLSDLQCSTFGLK